MGLNLEVCIVKSLIFFRLFDLASSDQGHDHSELLTARYVNNPSFVGVKKVQLLRHRSSFCVTEPEAPMLAFTPREDSAVLL